MSRIKRLEIKNCLGIKELSFNPGKITVISGGNEKSKTSILEVIEKGLYNSDRRAKFVRSGEEQAYIEITTDDDIKIERTVTADAAGNSVGNSVKVSSKGHPQNSPETFLKNLFGALQPGKKTREVFAFNPIDFMQKKDAEQTDILLGLLPISVSLADVSRWFNSEVPGKIDYSRHGLQVLKDLEKYWYDARREANSAVKHTEFDAEATASKLPDNYCLENWKDISLAELYVSVQEAQKTNVSREKAQLCINDYDGNLEILYITFNSKMKEAQEIAEFRKNKITTAHQEDRQKLVITITGIDNSIAELLKQIEELKQRKLDTEKDLMVFDGVVLDGKYAIIDTELSGNLKAIDADKQRELAALAAKKLQAETFLEDNPWIDLEPIQHKAEHAEKMKTFIPLATELSAINARLLKEQATAELYNMYVNVCREKPAELLANVELPIEGLGLDSDNRVTFPNDDGVPLPLINHSTSKQIRICLDIARAYAKDSPVQLICVDRLESLDTDNQAEFMKQIEESDDSFAYFVTLVTSGDLKIETKEGK